MEYFILQGVLVLSVVNLEPYYKIEKQIVPLAFILVLFVFGLFQNFFFKLTTLGGGLF